LIRAMMPIKVVHTQPVAQPQPQQQVRPIPPKKHK
jgi:hypothetical protein